VSIIFQEDFAAGNLNKFSQQLTGGGLAPTITAAPTGRTGNAVRFNLASGQQRSELQPKNASGGTLQFVRGDHFFIGRSDYISDAFGSKNTTSWQNYMQWKDGGPQSTSPPVAIELVKGSFELVAHNRFVSGQHVPFTPLSNGWHDFVYEVLLDGAGVGFISIWHNGTKLIDAFKPAAGTWYTDGGQTFTMLRLGL
jgi:hypothetical protein